MTSEPRLRPEDRADVERLVRQTLDAGAGPAGGSSAHLLRQVLRDADEIAAAAGEEYRAYLTAKGAFPVPRHPLWDAFAVLTPLVSATAAAVLLLTGYTLRLAGTAAHWASTMVTTGWLCALVAVVSGAVGLWTVLRTALNRPAPDPGDGEAAVAAARERWRRALLDRGLLPRLERRSSLAPRSAALQPGTAPALPTSTTDKETTGVGQSE
ncbi:hypothetical protein J7I94_18015 [Streptomyces sp. ISL-12]|uniref:hypothetical protein n=1 Tax=Streptomyces sp. ISL-12 TaxID=2819177 RepID=UPI001BE7ADF0|nr:hypothetical protein [Streptomyces sp. ISL-12]MBT2412441.1 hypothetical protein [Streptomyces sp. ISL-12]